MVVVKNKCLECGKEFSYSGRGRLKVYCSDACRIKHGCIIIKNKRKIENENRESYCLYCGKKIIDEAKTGCKKKFCNSECAYLSRNGFRKSKYKTIEKETIEKETIEKETIEKETIIKLTNAIGSTATIKKLGISHDEWEEVYLKYRRFKNV